MQIVQIQTAAHIVAITDWQDYRRDGGQFLNTAVQAYQKKKTTFNSEALYNLVCMGIEKYIMATLMRQGDLAENHTMLDLMDALERHTGPLTIREDLLFLDKFQEICSLENAYYATPTNEETGRIIKIGLEIEAMLLPFLADTKE